VKRRVSRAQNVSRMCLVCGVENNLGLHARFLELDSGELLGVFQPRKEHQSYPGRLHGGIATAILDETIGRAVSIGDEGAFGVTVELTVRFRKPVPLDAEVHAIGRITKDSSRLFEGTGEIVLPDGTVAVEASGRYLKMPVERIADPAFVETDWKPDTHPLPEEVDLGGATPAA
jgi:uncharacterized protein (TIGR00369 family)